MADIIINDVSSRAQYIVTSSQSSFTYPFPILSSSDLKVYVGTTLKSENTDYIVSGIGSEAGGAVVFPAGQSNGAIITIYRDMPVSRTTDYQTGGDLAAANLNEDLDRLTMMVQQQEEELQNNTIKVDQFDEQTDLTLPLKNVRKGRILGFNEITGDVQEGPTLSDTQSLSDISEDIGLLADFEDGTVIDVTGNFIKT